LYKGNSEEKHQIRAIFQEQKERKKERDIPRSLVPESTCDNKTKGKQLEKLLVRCACFRLFYRSLLIRQREKKRRHHHGYLLPEQQNKTKKKPEE
jgi:hypothetical protein